MREPVTLEDWDVEEPPRERPVFWPVWFWPVLVWMPLDAWHERFARDLPRLAPEALARGQLSPEALAWLATAWVLLAALAEAGVYGMLWAARGARLPFAAATVAVVQAGILELIALRVLDSGRAAPGPVAALLAGTRALAPNGQAATGMAFAFGSAGLLALARCALFAAFQASLARRRWREAFAITCGVWLASHVAQWWLLELFVGRSVFTGNITR